MTEPLIDVQKPAVNPLGRIKVHDQRSRSHEYPLKAATPGKSIRWSIEAPNLDQFYLGGCVGFSGTNMLNTKYCKGSRRMYNRKLKTTFSTRPLTHDDAIGNYSGATKNDEFVDEYPPSDTGSSALGLMKYWQELGIIQSYEWTFTFAGFLAALQRQPVLVGSWWYEGMGEPDKRGRVKATGDQVGGHEYLANAILWADQLIGFENSWGENWGERGKFYMTWSDVDNLIQDGGDVAVPRFL